MYCNIDDDLNVADNLDGDGDVDDNGEADGCNLDFLSLKAFLTKCRRLGPMCLIVSPFHLLKSNTECAENKT